MSVRSEQRTSDVDVDARRAHLRAALVGALAGLAWAAGLRALMAEVAGVSHVSWYGTFGAVLFPGAVAGALLGTAWARAASGHLHRIGWFALAPLVFAVLAPSPGQLAFAVLVMAGAYGIGARGAGWRRALGAVIGVAFVVALVVSISLAGGPRLALTTPRGAWVATLGVSLTVVLLLAEAVPIRASRRDREP